MMLGSERDRGLVLVLTLLVLLVLSAVALTAVQAVTNHLARAGSYRVSSIAFGITEAGSQATMAIAAVNPGAFNEFVAAHGYRVNMLEVSDAFFDMAEGGSFGREIDNVGGANWVSTLSLPISSHRAPGYSVGEYCFRKYFATTDGVYGNNDISTVDDVLRNTQKRFFSTIFVGPTACE